MLHPKINYPGELASIIEDLSRPMHASCLRDINRVARAGSEASLADGYELDAGEFSDEKNADMVLADWHEFMSGVMSTNEVAGRYRIRLTRGQPAGCPADAAEGYRIVTTADHCDIVARDVDGLRRAVFRLEDEMLLRRAPVLPLIEETRWTRIKTRITRSPIAPYRWLSGWELEDGNDYYPEAYLNRLAHCGINGIWVPGLLRNLVASKTIPELGPDKHRLEKLRRLVEKSARYGIKVYFFCIEPRALPLGHKSAVARPEMIGAKTDIYEALCPSTPLVLDYLREVTRELFLAAPGLGGLINIFCGERPTSCGWRDEGDMQTCPRCRGRLRGDVLADVLNAMTDGMHSADPAAELLAWTYIVSSNRETAPMAPMLEVMDKSRPEIVWLANFEHGGTKEVCGKPHTLHEYSLSYIGPAEPFVKLAQEARSSGRQVYAKLQLGTSCEMASVPYVPVPGIVYEKMSAMNRLGVTGSLLTWTFGSGGYPGLMLKAAGEAAFEPELPREAFLRRLAGIDFGEGHAEAVASAWEHFAEAWQEYPFDLAVLYYGPVTRSPAYQLHLEREARTTRLYNFGLERTRDPQFWTDQVERWTGNFTTDEIIRVFRGMAARWGRGQDLLTKLPATAVEPVEARKQIAVSAAVRLQCLSTANVYEFYSLRDRLREAAEEERMPLVKRMRQVAEDEIVIAGEMKRLMEVEPCLGYFVELYARVYSIPMIDEKIRQVRDMIATLQQWEKTGVESAVLLRSVEEAEKLRPDRWGD